VIVDDLRVFSRTLANRMMMNYNIVNFEERPDLYKLQDEISGKAFPAFLYYSEIAANTWDKMIEYYKKYQLLFLHEGKIICIFNCMPMNLDFSDEELPENAFEWGMAKGIKDFEDGKEINAALAIQIIIPKEYQGKGISHIDKYTKWKNEKGLPFDPWLRVHVKQNGKIIKPCSKAVIIKGTVEQWETWTVMNFPESGMYVVDGALCPCIKESEICD
jgi:hypothetical protein